ncbi:MAG: serine/threonine protein kinase [Planctomycetaceae bacterium]|nr:serine/threonine protein kinase [Planctomycetaceae bacterium]
MLATMNPPNAERAPLKAVDNTALKFVYASGSRPLTGYTIKRGIGRGGFGEVYFATSDAGKEVALKLVRRNLDIELRGVQQCLNLKHPNLLALYDIRQDEQGDSWVVMEFVDGQSLEDVLAAHPEGLSPEQALRWFDGLCAAVAYLHDHGIVHRDLKPGNVFCDGVSIEQGTVKLGDYGLSKFISVSRRSGQTESVGTVHYMAPEIANGRYGKEIDLYALGIMLYELFTGHVPFEGESVGEVLMKHLTAEPDLSRVNEPYRSAIAACLVKDPAKRPQSVAEIQALVAAARGDAIPAATAPRSASTTARASSATTWWTALSDYWNGLSENQRIAHRFVLFLLPLLYFAYRSAPLRALGYELFTGQFAGRIHPTALVGVIPGVIFLLVIVAVRWYHKPRAGSTAPLPRHHRPTEPHTPSEPITAVMVPELATRAQVLTPEFVGLRTTREQATDWVGSLIVSTFVAAAVCLMLILFRGQRPAVELYAWLTTSTVLGSWLILTQARYWESRQIELSWKRFSSALIGLAYGALAWLVDQALLVDLPYDARATVLVGHAFFDSSGQPELFAYLTYFGLLFLAVRWWRQAELLRVNRFSLWNVGGVMLMAWLVSWVAPFPAPWSWYSAVALAVTVQLSAPWRASPTASPRFVQTFVGGQWINV